MSFSDDQELPDTYSISGGMRFIPNGTFDQSRGIVNDKYIPVLLDLTNPRKPKKRLDRDCLGIITALNIVHGFGIKDREIIRRATDAFYTWESAHNRLPPGLDDDATPIAAAMIGARRGEEWVLEIAEFRHVSDNRRQLLAAVFDKNGPPPMPYEPDSGFLPSAKMTLELVHVLSALMQNLAGAN